MASPTCEVKDGSGSYTATTNGVNVTPSNVITIRLASTAGVDVWELSCVGADDASSASTINAGLTVDASTKTASFTMPGTVGQALIFQSRINRGQDVNGAAVAAYTTTFGVYALTSGSLRLLAYNEKFEGHSSAGWIKTVNDKIRQGVAAVPTGTGFVHITSGSADAAAKLVENADVHASAAIAASKLNLSTIAQAITSSQTLSAAGLTTTAGFVKKVRSVTGTSTNITNADFHVAVTPTANFTANLPTGAGVLPGESYEVSDPTGAAATYSITLDSGSGNTIDGAQTFVFTDPYGMVSVTCISNSAGVITWKVC